MDLESIVIKQESIDIYCCNICPEVYNDDVTYTNHILTHANAAYVHLTRREVYMCVMCRAVFEDQKLCNIHQLKHTQDVMRKKTAHSVDQFTGIHRKKQEVNNIEEKINGDIIETDEGNYEEEENQTKGSDNSNDGSSDVNSTHSSTNINSDQSHESSSSHESISTKCTETEQNEIQQIGPENTTCEENVSAKGSTSEDKESPPDTHRGNVSHRVLEDKRIREKDYCCFCNALVSNFSRHVVRHHEAESDVQKALSHPKNSQKRKQLLAAIRKKGNFNSQGYFKPMNKRRLSEKSDYLPCTNCLGFYKKKQLWRHVQKCTDGPAKYAQIDGQNLLVRNENVDPDLINKVFRRMKPDKVSLVAKKDELICLFGAQYLKRHPEEHFASIISRKMRDLAKLLLEIMKLKPEITSFEQVLKPQYYDTLVQATKIVARYSESLQKFDAPTYAMNISSTIKQCCNIALLNITKMTCSVQSSTIQGDLKTLIQLIEENWKFDISSQAADDLYMKKETTTSIIPLAADIKLFKEYLCYISNKSCNALMEFTENINVKAFNNLVESIFCRVFLLNRRRPGELQRLKLNDFNDNANENSKNEEFDKILTSSEKILVNKFKTIVIRYKRGRGIPVLFSPEVQEDIKKIMSVRNKYISDSNNLLFAKAGESCVCGYEILEKYAKASNAKKFKVLISTRLREYIATMSQLFSMSDTELEQLVTFMGLNVLKTSYRLPNDVYYTARISKLLLLMKNGKAEEYQGKTLDEIDLNMDEEIIGNEMGVNDILTYELNKVGPSCIESENNRMSTTDQLDSNPSQIICKPPETKRKRILIPWTTEQKNDVTKYYKSHIKNKRNPTCKENVSAKGSTSEEKELPPDAHRDNISNRVLEDKRIRERDYCCFCDALVTNFSRHVVRHHEAEFDVQKALSHPKHSLKRKQLLGAIRKKGNFNSQGYFKPMNKRRLSEKSDYLPCTNCLGFYKKKQLWKHVQKCTDGPAKYAQVDGQNLLVRNENVDPNLINKVFRRMKPDNVSLVAKTDELICLFGAQYLKRHPEEHFASIISCKMRELAKLLIEIMKLKPEITSFEQVLKPQYYDTLVQATKIVARYSESLQKFDAPSYAMNISPTVKQCCNIALSNTTKMTCSVQSSTIQGDLKTLIQLIEENWKSDISNQAVDDLYMKKMKTITIVPLAADLKLFKEYLCYISNKSCNALMEFTENINVKAFNNLVESTFCRVLLLNRRRPGELQRLKLNDYNDNANENSKNEEFDKILTSTEKILVNKFKTIVIRYKRGRGVPVLFSPEVQEDIKKIMSVRNKYISDSNNLLFAKAGESCVCGYEILEKYAKASNAKKFKVLISTRLREYIATMSQLFSMSDTELEQLVIFMGLNVLKTSYKLPNDVYYTARISKLLLLMKNGKAEEYQGKTLDEIDLNMDEEIIGNEMGVNDILTYELNKVGPSCIESENNRMSTTDQLDSNPSQIICKPPETKRKRILIPWTTEQKNVVTKYFKNHIENKKPPKQSECEVLKSLHPTLLHNKDWLKIKVFIQNIYKNEEKLRQNDEKIIENEIVDNDILINELNKVVPSCGESEDNRKSTNEQLDSNPSQIIPKTPETKRNDIEEYQGKTLDEIDLNMDQEIIGNEIGVNDILINELNKVGPSCIESEDNRMSTSDQLRSNPSQIIPKSPETKRNDIEEYQRKSSDEIDLNIDEEIIGNDRRVNDILTYELNKVGPSCIESENNRINTTDQLDSNPSQIICKPPETKKKRILIPWTTAQKSVVTKYFKSHIEEKKPPKRSECEVLKSLHPTLLHNKDWLKIKVFIQNIYKNEEKLGQNDEKIIDNEIVDKDILINELNKVVPSCGESEDNRMSTNDQLDSNPSQIIPKTPETKRNDIEEYQGKTLDEIDLNMDEEIIGNDIGVNDILINELNKVGPSCIESGDNRMSTSDQLHSNPSQIICNPPKIRKKIILVPLTTEQKNVVTKYFKNHIENNKTPKQSECENLKSLHPTLLHNKNWRKIKVFIHKIYKNEEILGENDERIIENEIGINDILTNKLNKVVPSCGESEDNRKSTNDQLDSNPSQIISKSPETKRNDVEEYQGKTLDEIDLNMNEEIIGNDVGVNDIITYELNKVGPSCIESENNRMSTTDQLDSNPSQIICKPPETKRKRILIPWTTEQKSVVTKYFKSHIEEKKPPKRSECVALKSLHPTLLHNKDWLKIKVFIQNIYNKNEKNLRQNDEIIIENEIGINDILTNKLNKVVPSCGESEDNRKSTNDQLDSNPSQIISKSPETKRNDIEEYQGKTLDEIDLNMDEEIIGNDIGVKDILTNELNKVGPSCIESEDNRMSTSDQLDSNPSQIILKPLQTKRKRILVPWTTEQNNVVTKYFKSHIKNKRKSSCKENVSAKGSTSVDKELPPDVHFGNVSQRALKVKRTRERDHCYFCDALVSNFSRHVVRHHKAELDVQKALSHPKNSRKRKQLFAAIRKKGNFVINSQGSFKPMKKHRLSEKSDYLPCSYCLGFYKKKYLWRHVQKCTDGPAKNARVDGQNLLVHNENVDPNLINKVFPRMKSDNVSLVAKTDEIICLFGAQYLKRHPEEHFASIISRKMRELAKLLLEIMKLKPEITSFEQVLKPQYYNTLVQATKIVARYSESLQKFDAPSYARNISRSIKECCRIALLNTTRITYAAETSTVQGELKTLLQLIEENWKFDVSSQASEDLYIKRIKTTTILPLAADIKLFKEYVCYISKKSCNALMELTENINVEAFNNLVESTFCRVLLLNRRRPGELQKLKLNDYNDNANENSKNEEFDKLLTSTEKILVNKFKTIVIRDKRGRGAPVLFSPEVQEDIKKILSMRNKYIPESNHLLFTKAGGSPLCGYKIVEKYAKASNAKNYKVLTSTSVRKYLATMTQLFSMTDTELEQLATVMGHTLNAHESNNKLPNDVYHTARISKLLLLMKDTKAEKYQGKALDEIDLNMTEEIIENEIEVDDILTSELNKVDPSCIESEDNMMSTSDELDSNSSEIICKPPEITTKRKLVPWTTEQKNVVTNYFENHIKNKKPPKQSECEVLKSLHPTLLQNKDWLKIKVFIQNIYKTEEKLRQNDEKIKENEIVDNDIVINELNKVVPSCSESEDNRMSTSDQLDSKPSQIIPKTPETNRKRILVPWTTEQKNVVTKYFENHIKNKKPPKQSECEVLKSLHPTLLQNKDWLKIKVFIQNIYKNEEKLRQNDEKIKENEIVDNDILINELIKVGPSCGQSEDNRMSTNEQLDSKPSQIIPKNPETKRKRIFVPWTTEQKNVVTKYFKSHIEYKKPPKQSECEALKSLHPTLLYNKDWLKIKVFIQNIYKNQ